MAVEAATPGKEIIDATQNAVIEAAENVANIIDNTAAELDGHHEVFYQSAEFWVAMAFVLVVAALARPIGRTVVALLKNASPASLHASEKRLPCRKMPKNCWPTMKRNSSMPKVRRPPF